MAFYNFFNMNLIKKMMLNIIKNIEWKLHWNFFYWNDMKMLLKVIILILCQKYHLNNYKKIKLNILIIMSFKINKKHHQYWDFEILKETIILECYKDFFNERNKITIVFEMKLNIIQLNCFDININFFHLIIELEQLVDFQFQ